MMRIAGVILAAGSSSRMGRDKLTLSLGGVTVLERTVQAFLSAGVEDITLAVSDITRAEGERLAGKYGCRLAQGGGTRGESVLNTLEGLDCDVVAIHDGARCLVSPEVILDSIATACRTGSGVAALPARDTLRGADGRNIDREGVSLMQTPQSFDYNRILAAYRRAREEGFAATDDCGIYERMWGKASLSRGSLTNQKLTRAEDLPFFAAMTGERRTGYGEDTHRLVQGRRLVLGGVEIPFDLGLMGHSDADVIAHAAIDALLGAAAMGDIGRMFPDTEAEYKDADSMGLLRRAWQRIAGEGWGLCSLDVTAVAQKPKLAPHIEAMRGNIAAAIGCGAELISVKATTPEHTGPEGRLESITARCVCLLRR